mgnify:FL=1
MFVFGSSYGDTGNVQRQDSGRPYPWSVPYGETWPGIPSGRYSDGHVLSEVLGKFKKPLYLSLSLSLCVCVCVSFLLASMLIYVEW